MTRATQSQVEQNTLVWLEGDSWRVLHGAEIAPGEINAERPPAAPPSASAGARLLATASFPPSPSGRRRVGWMLAADLPPDIAAHPPGILTP